MTPTNVLLLDDSKQYFVQLTHMLADPQKLYHLYWAKNVKDAVDKLSLNKCSVVLVSHVLKNGETGFDLLKHPTFKDLRVPAVFIVGQGEELVAVRSIRAGAYDYLVKDRFDSSRLMYTIYSVMKEHDYRVKVEAHQIELIKAATTDQLTGLLNRRHFMDCLNIEMARYLRYRMPLSVALLDIDHFRLINEEYGRDGGDFVLRNLSQLIKITLRSTDTVCRYGGEEFLIAFPNTDLLGTEIFAERLCAAISKHNFLYDREYIPVTASIGLAEAYPEIGSSELLLKLADKALYTAKKDGRNKVISYRYGSGL